MNLSNLIGWIMGIIMVLSGVYHIDTIQRVVWRAQARLIYESRTETWGSPNFMRSKDENRVESH